MENELLKVIERMDGVNGSVDDELILPYDLRQKARQRVTLASGRSAGLFLPRGTTLKNGDCLKTEEGLKIGVVAAQETVSIVAVADHFLMAKIAYHLGNRHVAIQFADNSLTYLHDHVLDDMVRGLGASVSTDHRPFEPEDGAYHSHGGAHSGSHAHSHHGHAGHHHHGD